MELTANGHQLDTSTDSFGELDDSAALRSDPSALRERLEADGYLFFRGLLDPELIGSARAELLAKYAIVGEVDPRHPIDEAIAGDRKGLGTANLRALSEGLRNGMAYRRLVEGPEMLDLHGDLFGEPAVCFDMRWPRFARPGEGCGFHCDGPYMWRATRRITSSWIPLGRVRREEGALLLLEGSHVSEDLWSGYLAMDADEDGLVWLDENPEKVRRRYGRRWLTTDFSPGDVLCFSMAMLHGALDNRSATGRCRLTSDTRYQPASEPADPRWNGPDFPAHGRDKVFYPGLGTWNNAEFMDEWKPVDEFGRLDIGTKDHPGRRRGP